jgi:hypothetical protein
LCTIALVGGCNLAPLEPEQSGAVPDPVLESRSDLADVVEVAACELEVDCCGNLNCAPAPCPIVCL